MLAVLKSVFAMEMQETIALTMPVMVGWMDKELRGVSNVSTTAHPLPSVCGYLLDAACAEPFCAIRGHDRERLLDAGCTRAAA